MSHNILMPSPAAESQYVANITPNIIVKAFEQADT